MEFKSLTSISTTTDAILLDLNQGLDKEYDLGILFFSKANYALVKEIVERLKKHTHIKNFIGCSSAGVIGSQEEIEHRAAVTLILAKLPGVKITPLSMQQAQFEKLTNKKDLYEYLEVFPNEKPVFLTFPDPFNFDMNSFLETVNGAFPGSPIIGGIASAGVEPKMNLLIINDEYYDEGMVGVVLTGDLRVEIVVSQGCRPIGQTYIVTKAEANIIYELAGKPFLQVLEEVLENAPDRDRRLAEEAILLGVAMDEYKHGYRRGDFLIRGLMGIDEKTGAGAIGDYIQSGQTIQFHVRDAESATEDLNELLIEYQNKSLDKKPKGALIFSCNGRGENLFKQKNHDINIIQKHIGPIPAVGFFCAGEIGPVGGHNFLHGFTDSIALFYPTQQN
jgi:small ligand-binding sensory domain FIST